MNFSEVITENCVILISFILCYSTGW